MGTIEKTTAKFLVDIAATSPGADYAPLIAFADVLVVSGPYRDATENEIDEFDALLEAAEAA